MVQFHPGPPERRLYIRIYERLSFVSLKQKMTIRKAQVKDKKEISGLYYQLYPEHKGAKKLIPIQNFRAKNLLFVAEEENKIIGFVWGTFINYGISRYGYIEELFVNKKFRGKKIGTFLVKRILEEFKKLKVWALFVSLSKEDKMVLNFYKKLGFKPCRGSWLYFESGK